MFNYQEKIKRYTNGKKQKLKREQASQLDVAGRLELSPC